MPVIVDSNFIGKFKIGDNIIFNLGGIERFYPFGDVDPWANKIVIYTLASIAEAILYDLLWRAKHFTREGINGLAKNVVEYLASGRRDDFSKYIAAVKSKEILGVKEAEVYARLDELRRLRNRIHIQNEKNDFHPDEYETFTNEKRETAEATLEEVCGIISTNHERHFRGGDQGGFLDNFVLPWEGHLPR